MSFHWSLSDSKSPLVSRILLSILADFNNAVVWMVSTRPLISQSFSRFNNPLLTVPRAPKTIGIIVTFMFHSFFFFNSIAESRYLSFSFTFFQFYSEVSQASKVYNFESSPFFFLLNIIKSGLLAEINVSVCSKGVYMFHFLGQILGCTHTIFLYGQI